MQLNDVFTLMKIKNIIHRDIKPENILIKYTNPEKTEFDVRLSDYGISKRLTTTQKAKTNQGTIYTKAPEVINEEEYDGKADLWSLGVVIYFLYFKEYPFDDKSKKTKAIERKILSGNPPEILPEDPELKDLILKLLEIDVDKRLSWDQYLNHSFFQNSNNSNNSILKNEIILTLEINQVNKDTYFMDNTENSAHLKELDESNVELFICGEKKKFQKYFNPERKGIFYIKLKFKNNIKNISSMFNSCYNIIEIDLSSFDAKNITDISYMFYRCFNLRKIDLSSFNTKNVSDMSYMFYYCKNLKNIDLSSFDTKNVTNMSCMFYCCANLENINFSTSFNTKNVTNMRSMFYGCSSLNDFNLSSFDTKNVTNMAEMFRGCSGIKNLDLTAFDTRNVSDMNCMFEGCVNLENLDLYSFDTKNVINMASLFSGCTKLERINLSSFDTKNVTDMSSLFVGCKIKDIDLSSFDTKNVINISFMFSDCKKLKSIKIKKEMKNLFNQIGKRRKRNIDIIQI